MIRFVGPKRCVVAVAVAVAVDVLASVFRERILGIGPPVIVLVGATKAAAFGRRARFAGAVVAVRPVGFVAVAVAIAVKPLRGVVGPQVAAITRSVAVAVRAE